MPTVAAARDRHPLETRVREPLPTHAQWPSLAGAHWDYNSLLAPALRALAETQHLGVCTALEVGVEQNRVRVKVWHYVYRFPESV